MVPTGYGKQTALVAYQLRSLGHEVGISAFWGLQGSIIDWNGIPVYPKGRLDYGVDVLVPHARHFGADLVITLMDTWKLLPAAQQLREWREAGGRLACWTPVDCNPLASGDRRLFQITGATPIAMSSHGWQMMTDAGLAALLVPHSVNTEIYRPDPDGRAQLRADQGVADKFVIGICAANKDAIRKGWPEQLRAFELFRRTCPDSELWCFTQASPGSGGYDLREMATDLGVADAVKFTDEYAQLTGLIDEQDMAIWYNALDVLSCCSWGEGFGLPILEAQACGTPAVATNAASMRELAVHLVPAEEIWNAVHQAWWHRPRSADIAAAYRSLRDQPGNAAEAAQETAAEYAVDRVTDLYWRPVLDKLGAGA